MEDHIGLGISKVTLNPSINNVLKMYHLHVKFKVGNFFSNLKTVFQKLGKITEKNRNKW